MFYGTKYFKPLSGFGMIAARSGKLNLGVSGTDLSKRGAILGYGADDQEFVLCDAGQAFAGFQSQDVNVAGLTMLNVAVTKNPDYPLRDTVDFGTAYVPEVGALFEVEGAGAAALGNLVATSGTGAIASNTAKGKLLSCLNGCLRIAQVGDVALFELLKANLTAEVEDDVRILVKYNGAGVIVTPDI